MIDIYIVIPFLSMMEDKFELQLQFERQIEIWYSVCHIGIVL